MEELSYFEAWRTWWTGVNVTEFRLWGLPVLVWARIGKVLQFMAGLAIVLDLIGPEKLRDIARKLGARNWDDLRRRVAEQRARHDWRKTVAAGLNSQFVASDPATMTRLAAVEIALERKERRYANLDVVRGGELTQPILTSRDLRDARRATRTRYQLGAMIVCLLLVAHLMSYLPAFEAPPYTGTFIGVISIVVIDRKWPVWKWYYPFSIVWVVIGSGYRLMVYGVAVTIVRLIGRDNAGRPMRWIAFALFVIGFHFDLLGS